MSWQEWRLSEFERDEHDAARVGADGLSPILKAWADAKKNGEETDALAVAVVLLALRTDSRYAPEVVKHALAALEASGWYEFPEWTTSGERPTADELTVLREREHDVERIDDAFRVAQERDRPRFRPLRQMHDNKVRSAWRRRRRTDKRDRAFPKSG